MIRSVKPIEEAEQIEKGVAEIIFKLNKNLKDMELILERFDISLSAKNQCKPLIRVNMEFDIKERCIR